MTHKQLDLDALAARTQKKAIGLPQYLETGAQAELAVNPSLPRCRRAYFDVSASHKEIFHAGLPHGSPAKTTLSPYLSEFLVRVEGTSWEPVHQRAKMLMIRVCHAILVDAPNRKYPKWEDLARLCEDAERVPPSRGAGLTLCTPGPSGVSSSCKATSNREAVATTNPVEYGNVWLTFRNEMLAALKNLERLNERIIGNRPSVGHHIGGGRNDVEQTRTRGGGGTKQISCPFFVVVDILSVGITEFDQSASSLFESSFSPCLPR
ncbi:hypothetical protein FA13DRAFT_1711992 [Coprinellus micaceus]|uniref:Uncharacterized protein n=1 Tax=Coprinellus micaceus TaxID=71717 RepID=A0A4Y7T216_COPMI|nr:hypothetical protein FA13DRAFT_1711992 [Coprinellus micaceus]